MELHILNARKETFAGIAIYKVACEFESPSIRVHVCNKFHVSPVDKL